MCDVKSVIALLCKHLKLLYDCDIRNEHFRLAKFNESKDDTVINFWYLLLKIVEEDQRIVFKEENIVNFVKLNFAVMEYNSLQFYALPTDMSSGSRELLLALGWLMASRNILESATKKKIVNSKISKEFGGLNLNDTRKEVLEKQNIKNCKSACELVLWYAGKIRHNLNAIEELSHEWMHIMTKIHEDTRLTCGLPHLSTSDIKLIHYIEKANNCEELNAEVACLKESVTLIETQKHWHKKDAVFWEWMESVVEKEHEVSKCLNIEQKQELANFLKILKANMEKLVREINRASTLGENVKQLFQKDAELFSGLPRFILQENDGETDVETLLQNFSVHIAEAEKKLEWQLNSAWSSLESLSKKMSALTILDA